MADRNGAGAKIPAKTVSGSARAGTGKKTPPQGRGKSWVILFWLAFVIFITGLFLFNRESINASLNAVRKEPAARSASGSIPEAPPVQTIPLAPPAAIPQQPSALPPGAAPQPETPEAQNQPSAPPPAAAPQSTQHPQEEQSAPELRERVLYFTQVDRDGIIARIKVNRRLPVSDSPMTDVLRTLVSGPSEEEHDKGLISLIPPGTQILSATVRGETAHISFSEDFQYNTYGVDGYIGQLREIIYTATEFPNVSNVQILIEGRPVNFLGEGIWVGTPIGRETF